jgi:hypothetical protein
MSDEDAAKLVEEHLSFDAYRHNEEEKVYYKNGDNVEGLEHVLYKCPVCEQEFTIEVKDKNKLSCKSCGYTVKSDNYGILSLIGGGEPMFKYPSDWHAYIEESVYEYVKDNPNFYYETRAELRTINEKKHKYETIGFGMIGFDYDKFVMEGTLRGEPFREEIPTSAFPILPFRPGAYFEIQHGDEIYRCVPEDGRLTMKFINMVKIFYEMSRAASSRA